MIDPAKTLGVHGGTLALLDVHTGAVSNKWALHALDVMTREREICLLAVERCRGWPASNLRPSPPMTTSYHSSSTSAIPS